jgi:5-methylcytosine-specific restriction endonuclease McrA
LNIEKYREKDKKYSTRNKEILKARGREYYQKNIEKKRKYSKNYYKNNQVKALEHAKKYYEINKKHILEIYNKRKWIFREKYLLQAVIWSGNRRTKINASSDGTVTVNALEKLLEKQTYQCNLCHQELKTIIKHLDHITPLCVGGKHILSNVQWLCAKCNLTKPKSTYESNNIKISKGMS